MQATGDADICLVCQGMSGGVGTNIHNLYKGLRDRGCRVDLVCGYQERRLLDESVRERDIFALSSLDYRKGLADFTGYLEANRPGVIVTPQIRPTITALRARASLNCATKIYPRIHSTYSLELKRLSLSKRIARTLRLRYYYPKCDGIIAVSSGVAEDFARLTGIGDSAVSTIYNPLDNGKITALASQPLEHPWFARGQPPVILGMGRLNWEKNFQLLIEAFETVRSTTPSRLMILGEGPEREKLEARIRNSPYRQDIALPGHVANPYPYLKRAALFTLASRYEGLPNVVLEALATGTPVVSTDCPGGPGEILMDGRYGHLVPLNDSGKLAQAVCATLAAPLPGKILKARAFEFDIDISVERFLKLFGLTGDD